MARQQGKKLSKNQRRQVKNIVQSEISPEMKNVIYEEPATSVTSAGYLVDITAGIAKGLEDYERVGDTIKLKEMLFNYEVLMGQSLIFTTDTYNHVRIIVFRWYGQAGPAALPTIGDVLSTTGLVTNVFKQYNQQNIDAGLLRICYDRSHEIFSTPVYTGSVTQNFPGVDSTDGVMNKKLSLKKLGKHDVNWSDNATYGSNHIFLLAISDSTVSPHPEFEWSSTIRYTDS